MNRYLVGPETDRLRHRALTISDAEALFALNGDPKVMKFTCEPLLESVRAAEDAIENYPDFDTVGYGRWACVLKETDQVIGFCGLKYLPDLDAVDVGYRFLPAYWGQGLATEACRACLAFGFDELQLDEIIALVLPANQPSARVAEKAGMHCERRFVYDGQEVLRYVKRRKVTSTDARARRKHP